MRAVNLKSDFVHLLDGSQPAFGVSSLIFNFDIG